MSQSATPQSAAPYDPSTTRPLPPAVRKSGGKSKAGSTVASPIPSAPSQAIPEAGAETSVHASVDAELHRQHTIMCARIDGYFVWLMLLQWAAAIATALWISPLAWAPVLSGGNSSLHPHLSIALFYGGALTLVPIALTRLAPGQRITRLTIAVAQMLMGSLLIHLTGGRIETHFHTFGSLAFLAFYIDWQVLVAASVTIALDRCLRGIYMPHSVFGVYAVQPWRWLEHVGWVLFCDIFLIPATIGRLTKFRELTTRHLERGELLHRAYYDPLTGLPNRTFLLEKLSEAIREAREAAQHNPSTFESGFGCLYVDLDQFKDVNDLMGHTFGDSLLRAIADRLKSRLGDQAFLARVAGDEFVVIVPEPRPSEHLDSSPQMALALELDSLTGRAEEAARIILRSLLQPLELQGTPITVGASIGISRFPRDGQDQAEILANSEKAMYRAKRAGRNDYLVYSPELFAESVERHQAEARLHRAIAERELQLHYQPIFRADGSLSALEALLRWHDPIRGNIPPSYFIPLAEETGLIVQLGSFVLHEACKQASEWLSRGIFFGSIAVNVSSIELAREDFAASVILTLRQHYTPAGVIELEVTESALVNDFALAERHLRQLRSYGLRVSIDDFGTGYSSLGRLRQLTLDTLKIDRLFVEGVATSEADRTVVEHIIAMAHTLGMTVIAEGVETDAQLQILRSLSCDQIQGYLLAKPMSQKSTESLLHQHTLTNIGQ